MRRYIIDRYFGLDMLTAAKKIVVGEYKVGHPPDLEQSLPELRSLILREGTQITNYTKILQNNSGYFDVLFKDMVYLNCWFSDLVIDGDKITLGVECQRVLY